MLGGLAMLLLILLLNKGWIDFFFPLCRVLFVMLVSNSLCNVG